MKRDVTNIFQECKMIAVVQNNSTNAEDMMILKNRLHKHGIVVKFFPNQVMVTFDDSACSFGLMFCFKVETKLLMFVSWNENSFLSP